jgi:imidazolonepropionase-like amidohydrolase
VNGSKARKLVGGALVALSATLSASVWGATTVIHAGHLIAEPGGAESTDQSVIIEDGKIVAVKAGFLPGDKVIDLKDSWVMPGLIDMHTHSPWLISVPLRSSC